MIKYFILFLPMLFLSACESTPVETMKNATISIQYIVTKTAHVRVTIENAYGTTVTTLVDKEQNYGNYTVPFALDGRPEGVYYFVLEISGEETIRKHLLVIAP